MDPQHQHPQSAAFDLHQVCVYLARDGSMRSYAKTAELFRSSGESGELMDGRMLALHCVSSPQDVHYPVWEMHPEGDELLIVASGAVSVEFRDSQIPRTALLPGHAACIVPAGVWHRLIVHQPSVLIAITQRHNTVHA